MAGPPPARPGAAAPTLAVTEAIQEEGRVKAVAMVHAETSTSAFGAGDMGRHSYVLVGTAQAMPDTFGSSCHCAGRRLSRGEEMSEACKEVARVVRFMDGAGISRLVARLEAVNALQG